MKTLIFTRHAKSSWDDLTLSDHERTLNARGRASATAIGKWLQEKGHHPDQAISSNAARCVETWDLISAELPPVEKSSFHQRLYLAAPTTIYEALKQASGDTVIMLGHNPGFGELAMQLAQNHPDHPKFQMYPTAATTVLRFDIPDWSTPFLGTGTVVDFIVPRDLTE
ncbi:histidine phosphatase family protein [Amylibacter sp. IMCC11727]|uniref:SixA phosphatase family protein n=1 Tax=Amylibacter sp. IMCC11727 TaxID=3039851 RepID=UPI00244E2E78|nr:histidine phosphatase family protein [Amylibacter sp. IMCC11727]WGI22497.1 histidine phosphatase family protein [Amylibacter sp. IMCC11727]